MNTVEVTRTENDFSSRKTSNPLSPDLVRSLREDGAIVIKNALNGDELSIIKDAFELHLQMSPPWTIEQSKENSRFIAAFLSPEMMAAPVIQRLWSETKLVDIAQQAFTTPEVWLWYEQIFFKEGSAGEKVKRTDWHQDLSIDPVEGSDVVRFWISLDPVEPDYALEFIRGSHRGPIYHGEGARKPNGEAMPRLPDIEANRSQFDILSWATEPGDIIAFHPGIIHGGGSTKPNGVRRTLVTVFFGRDAHYSPKPPPPEIFGAAGTDGPTGVQRERLAKLQPGDPISLTTAPQLR